MDRLATEDSAYWLTSDNGDWSKQKREQNP